MIASCVRAAAVFALALLLSCAGSFPPPTEKVNALLPVRDPVEIKLTGEWDESEREFSGSAVYEDSVVLLPQYPERVGDRLALLPLNELQAVLANRSQYTPRTIQFDDDGLSQTIDGFEGFEAIAFRGEEVFLTIESHQPDGMMGFLVRGRIQSSDTSFAIRLDAGSRIPLPPRVPFSNMTDEAIVVLPGNKLLTIYEANGGGAIADPHAYLFETSAGKITRLPDVPLPRIEYRITDCSPANDRGVFWCINYMFPGDESKLQPERDRIAERWGIDSSQSRAWKAGNRVVERLVQFRFDGRRVHTTDTPPVYLTLRNDGKPRNWEGMAFFPDHGFFLATDKFPESIFAFIPER